MFGYVTTNMEEMKVKDYRKYRAFYCGICQDLKEYHGQPSRLTLTYDMTFLAILLTGLYESAPVSEQHLWIGLPVIREICWERFLSGRKISGQGRFGRLDFSWGNLFI